VFKPDQIFVFVDFETTGIDTSTKSNDWPIEIACVFTDHNLKMLRTYTAPIFWPQFKLYLRWPDSYLEAAEVHRIPFDKLREQGAHPVDVANDLNNLCAEFMTTDRKPTLISDAPNFEAFHMQRLYKIKDNMTFPFHYNWWSVYPAITMFDEKPALKLHRALDDVIVMYDAFLRAHVKASVNNLMIA
jgi:hypothetical protein